MTSGKVWTWLVIMPVLEFNGEDITIDDSVFDDVSSFSQIICDNVWNDLSVGNRQYLETFLPSNDMNHYISLKDPVILNGIYKTTTILYDQIMSGYWFPEVVKLRKLCTQSKLNNYKLRLKSIQLKILGDVVDNRKVILNRIKTSSIKKYPKTINDFQIYQQVEQNFDKIMKIIDPNEFQHNPWPLDNKQTSFENTLKNTINEFINNKTALLNCDRTLNDIIDDIGDSSNKSIFDLNDVQKEIINLTNDDDFIDFTQYHTFNILTLFVKFFDIIMKHKSIKHDELQNQIRTLILLNDIGSIVYAFFSESLNSAINYFIEFYIKNINKKCSFILNNQNKVYSIIFYENIASSKQWLENILSISNHMWLIQYVHNEIGSANSPSEILEILNELEDVELIKIKFDIENGFKLRLNHKRQFCSIQHNNKTIILPPFNCQLESLEINVSSLFIHNEITDYSICCVVDLLYIFDNFEFTIDQFIAYLHQFNFINKEFDLEEVYDY